MRFEERLLRSIVRVHSRFLADEDPHPLFEELLEDLLDFTESDYGFLGETMVSPSGALSLKVHAFGSRPPGRAALESFRSSAPDGLELGSPHTLIGAVLRTAKPVLANEPSSDPRRGGLPPGHPPLQSFLGIPLHHGHRFVGMMGAANRAGGYTQELLARLEPFIVTSASVVDARRSIRERRRAEEAQARLVAILEATTDVIGTADAQGRLTYLNRAARRLRGIGEDGDLSGVSVLAGHTPWARRRILEEALPAAVRDGSWEGETAVVAADGREIPLSQVLIAHKDAHARIDFFSTIARDISERRALEQELRQAQKMEAIGRLAGGIAHDFNNILTAVFGNAELARRQLKDGGAPLEALDEILQAATRAAGLTRQLLTFSRRGIVEPRWVDLNELARRMERMLRRLIGEDVELQLDLAPRLGGVSADEGQLEQLLMNLVVNARDAMPDGGRLRIETRDVTLAGDAAHAVELATGRYVRLTVSDTGVGMSEETRGRIFEPFFTTKPPGRGTGLGLAICYGVVQQSGGRIGVESVPGSGARFAIHLPRVEETEAVAPERGTPSQILGEAATLLLAEDEPQVRVLLARALRERGYTVMAAADGEAALSMARRHEGSIDLLVTDVVMPRLGGRALAASLRAMRPGTPVLYVSGHPEGPGFSQALAEPWTGYVAKPFSADDLLRKVRELLEETRGGS